MEKLEQLINQEVERVLEDAKSKATTYGEVQKIIRDMEWGTRDGLKTLISQMANRRLQEEMETLPIKK